MATLTQIIAPFLSKRFVKYCLVGLSGIGVNLLALAFWSEFWGLHTNLASALAIEMSIITNFFANEYFTFCDIQENSYQALGRFWRFHLVALVGALVQWTVFVFGNVLWLVLAFGPEAYTSYFAPLGDYDLYAALVHLVRDPPNVGPFKYVSQLFGIFAATALNFLGNLYWTWGERERNSHGNEP